MGGVFLIYRYFQDEAIAFEVCDILTTAGIKSKVEKTPQILDSQIIGTSSEPEFVLKLFPEDFSKANKILEGYFEKTLTDVEEDYYLFSFTNDELNEILQKPDEWGFFDYQLAKKILSERGCPASDIQLEKMKKDRILELEKPAKTGKTLFLIAYLFILSGLMYLASPRFIIDSIAFLQTVVSVIIGQYIYKNKNVLPDGKIVFSFEEKSRKHAELLRTVAVVVLVACVLKYFYFLSSFN